MVKKYTYTPDIPEVFRCRVPLAETHQAFVMNGILREEVENEEGLTIISNGDSGFNLSVAPGAHILENTQLIGVRDASNTESISFVNVLSFGKNSESSILLCTHTLSMDEFSTESVLNIAIESDARVNIVVMQNEHNKSSHKVNFNIVQKSGSYLRVNIVTLHGGSIENTIDAKLEGENATCELNGIYLVDGKQEIKTTVNLHHLVPRCHSSQLFKGILNNESKAFFSGKINVSKDAQKTEAFQANHNLLLSRKAKIYAQPQLEIYADDVKCSHGATSGRLDENALFYMRSRGIGAEEAKLLQQIAFVYDVLEKINNEQLQKRLQELVESRLRGEFSHCSNCSVNCC